MIKVSKKTLTRSLIGLSILIIGIISITIFILGDKVKYTVEKETIEKVIKAQLPLIKEIEIKQNIPKFVSNKISGQPTIEIYDIETVFYNEKINANITGLIDFENKKYPFKVKFDGTPIYKDYSFFLDAKNIEIDLNNLKISSIVKNKLSEIEDNSKLLNKLSILKDTNNNLTKTFITPEIEAKIDSLAILEIQKAIQTVLAKKPIYVLKDDLKQNSVKVALNDIKITETGIDIYISITKIFIFILTTIFTIILTIGLLIFIIKNPDKVIFGFIEVTGAVLEGTADILG